MFYVFAGLASLAGVAVLLAVPRDPPQSDADRRVDWIGAAIITSSLVVLQFVLAQGQVVGWATGCTYHFS